MILFNRLENNWKEIKMSKIYNEFKINPWNFIKKNFGISLLESEIEDQYNASRCNLNYRILMLYQNNGLMPTQDEMNYEKLLSSDTFTTIFYFIYIFKFYIPFQV